MFNLFIFKRGHFLLIFNHTYECLYHNLWWKIDLQNWRWKIKDQDQFVKITSSDLDRTKDQDQLSDLDLGDRRSWSFYNSAPTSRVDKEGTVLTIPYLLHSPWRLGVGDKITLLALWPMAASVSLTSFALRSGGECATQFADGCCSHDDDAAVAVVSEIVEAWNPASEKLIEQEEHAKNATE